MTLFGLFLDPLPHEWCWPTPVWRDILIFQKNSLFPQKSRPQMLRDTLTNPLSPPCGIWWHFPVQPPPPVESVAYYLNGPLRGKLRKTLLYKKLHIKCWWNWHLLEYFSEEPVNPFDPDPTIRQRMTDRDICESVASLCTGNFSRKAA